MSCSFLLSSREASLPKAEMNRCGQHRHIEKIRSRCSSLGRTPKVSGSISCPDHIQLKLVVLASVKLRAFSDIVGSRVMRANTKLMAGQRQRSAINDNRQLVDIQIPETSIQKMAFQASLIKTPLRSARNSLFSPSYRSSPSLPLFQSNFPQVSEGNQQNEISPINQSQALLQDNSQLLPSASESAGGAFSDREIKSTCSENSSSNNSMLEVLLDEPTEDSRSIRLQNKLDFIEAVHGFHFREQNQLDIELNSSHTSVSCSIELWDEESGNEENILLGARLETKQFLLHEAQYPVKNLLIPVIQSY